jgi:DHA1 family bicyclomycin/chloramphenicol resistance-like MFS transporter
MQTENKMNQKSLILLLGTLTALDPLTIDMYLPAFSNIERDFQTSMANVELSVTTFFIGMALGQLLYGPLADRYGRKKPLLIGMMVYFLATIGCALSPNIEMFIFCRLLQAIGGCAGMVITRAIIRDLFEPKQVAIFLSNMALVMGIAPIIAPSVGSLILQIANWKTIFWVLAGANLLCMFSIFTFLPETNTKRQTSTNIGKILKSYWGLFKDKKFLGYLIPDTSLRAGMFAYIAGSPFVFIQLLHIPANKYGIIFGLNGLGLMAASQINRRLLKKYNPEQILQAAIKVAAIVSIIVFLASWTIPLKIILLTSIFIFLATLNFVSPNSLAGALENHGHQAGLASALYGCLQWSMASFSSLLVSSFHNGTALPMTGVILFCGMLSFFSYHFLVKRNS